MYDTTERVRRVKQTALRLIQKRERTALRRLGTLCTVLALGLTGALAVRARNQVQRYVIEHSRLGIPTLFSSECPHGHQALDGYLLPVNLASGCTFAPQLLEDAAETCTSSKT